MALAIGTLPGLGHAQVGFTIQLGQPDYYGGLSLQNDPQPQF